MGIGKKLKLGIERSCRLCIKTFFSVYDRFLFRMILQEILSHKRIGLVRTFVINTALPGIQAILADSLSGTRFDAGSALIADVVFQYFIEL